MTYYQQTFVIPFSGDASRCCLHGASTAWKHFHPNTLHKWADEQIAVPMKKKERKRKNKKETMSQPELI
jgi:hypothetical protein